ncbi:MAG TPA: MauE/DoxX family redox-associated membrane protein [Flavisolibacter sp.]|jgi:hypothetical protein|nr:MauE/DoxX family redox-associated membrane protein [Flavisolibacter sp.]
MQLKSLVTWTYTTLVFLFAYTATSKLMAIDQFKDVLWQAPLLGKAANFFSWLVPLTELVIVGLLLIPSTRLTGLYTATALLLLFTGYLLYMLLFSPHLPCQCGGIISTLDWKTHLLVNLFLLVAAGSSIRTYKRSPEKAAA